MQLKEQVSDAFSSKVSHNMVSNIVRTVLMALIGLLMVPYYLDEFGLATYAILPLATTVTNYFIIISDSIANAFSRYMVIAIQNKDVEGTNRVFTTSVIGLGKCMALMLLFSVVISVAAPYIFQTGESSRVDVQSMFFMIMAASMAISFSASLGSVYMAYNKLYITYWSRAVQTLSQVVLVVGFFLAFGPSLPLIGVSYVVSAVIMFVMMAVPLKRVCSTLSFSYRLYDKNLLRSMGTLGIWSTLSEMGNLLFIQASMIVVNMMLGSHIQGTFSIAANVIMMIHTACTAVAASSVPLIYRNYANKDSEGMVRTLHFFSKFIGITMAFPIAFLLMFMPQVIEVWLGSGYEDLYPLLWIMVPIEVTVCAVSAYLQVPIAYMQVRPVAAATIVTGLINILGAILVILFTDYGVLGVCIVWSASMLLLKVGFFPTYCSRLTKSSIVGMLKPIVLSNAVFVMLLGVFYAVTEFYTLPSTWLAILLLFFIGFVLFFIVSLRFLYSRDEKTMIVSFLPGFVQRFIH